MGKAGEGRDGHRGSFPQQLCLGTWLHLALWHRGSFPLASIPLFQVWGGAGSSSCCTCGTASVSKPLRCSGSFQARFSTLGWGECLDGIRVCRGLQAAPRGKVLAKDGQTKSKIHKKKKSFYKQFSPLVIQDFSYEPRVFQWVVVGFCFPSR